jgi:transcriptional regulator with XRE-family HTH domain
MDAVRFGSDVRLLRARKRWTQARLAAEAGVSRWAVGAAESGHGPRLATEDLIKIVTALGAYLSIRIQFQGEALDRLRDRRHAMLVESTVARLLSHGWEVATEVSFSVFGERGSIDILAFHPATGTLLVVEVKTVVPDVGGMLATIDRKVRLAPDLARARGWDVRSVARLLVLSESTTSRRRIADHVATFENAFPSRNVAVPRWLRAPTGAISGLLFLPPARQGSTRHGRDRVGRSGERDPRTGDP